ncbi:unnamed protein product [Linum tenue]|uniref:Uncharacterized protein n=1 Tax=Linum tenue TaxID=586396 RepID=A0AAV0K8U9_9ROSI|nr:unnamed protein product [Linum tenue]
MKSSSSASLATIEYGKKKATKQRISIHHLFHCLLNQTHERRCPRCSPSFLRRLAMKTSQQLTAAKAI